jgi:ubiquinone/menaquinone biosynthesis C-methylase UbiE
VLATFENIGPSKKVLDLGAGVCRHSLPFAENGCEVTAFDAAESGLASIEQLGKEKSVSIKTVLGKMDQLPFANDYFDHVLSWNVIYHGNHNILIDTVNEIKRVLKPGGTFHGTMLPKKRIDLLKSEFDCKEISTNTWIVNSDSESDKAHPHYYCTANELTSIFKDFEFNSLTMQEHDKPNSWHWHLMIEKL